MVSDVICLIKISSASSRFLVVTLGSEPVNRLFYQLVRGNRMSGHNWTVPWRVYLDQMCWDLCSSRQVSRNPRPNRRTSACPASRDLLPRDSRHRCWCQCLRKCQTSNLVYVPNFWSLTKHLIIQTKNLIEKRKNCELNQNSLRNRTETECHWEIVPDRGWGSPCCLWSCSSSSL